MPGNGRVLGGTGTGAGYQGARLGHARPLAPSYRGTQHGGQGAGIGGRHAHAMPGRVGAGEGDTTGPERGTAGATLRTQSVATLDTYQEGDKGTRQGRTPRASSHPLDTPPCQEVPGRFSTGSVMGGHLTGAVRGSVFSKKKSNYSLTLNWLTML